MSVQTIDYIFLDLFHAFYRQMSDAQLLIDILVFEDMFTVSANNLKYIRCRKVCV